jgi:hypothetical protein
LDWTTRNGWAAGQAQNQKFNQLIVVFRDPVERWISGVGQYLTSYVLNVTGAYSWETGPGPNDQQISADQFISEYTTVVERLLFDQLSILDDHVWPQTDFFVNLKPEVPRIYIYLDQNFEKKIGNFLKISHINGLDCNKGSDNSETKKIIDFIKQRLNTRPELVDRIKSAYANDYAFIKNTKFI